MTTPTPTRDRSSETPADARSYEYFGRRLSNTLELERAEIRFEPIALGILGAIYDLGQISCADLAARLETSEEWIWFSRLQRARLVQDVGTAFSLSSEGHSLVERLLSEDAAS